MSKIKTRDVIYWVSVIGPLLDGAIGFVKGIASVIKSGELITEYKKARDERVKASLDSYISEVRERINNDFDNEINVSTQDVAKFIEEKLK